MVRSFVARRITWFLFSELFTVKCQLWQRLPVSTWGSSLSLNLMCKTGSLLPARKFRMRMRHRYWGDRGLTILDIFSLHFVDKLFFFCLDMELFKVNSSCSLSCCPREGAVTITSGDITHSKYTTR